MKVTRISHLVLVAMLIMAILFGAVAVGAQEPDVTIASQPFVIVTEEAGDASITCQEGATCVLNEAPEIPEERSVVPNAIPTPVVIVGAIILGIVFLLFLYNQRQVNELLARAIPAEAVPGLIEAAMPTLTTLMMNTVARAIPTDIDDKLFIQAAADRGLVVAKNDITGEYETTRKPAPASKPSSPYPPTTGRDLGTDLTSGSAGASGAGGDPFPRTPNRNS